MPFDIRVILGTPGMLDLFGSGGEYRPAIRCLYENGRPQSRLGSGKSHRLRLAAPASDFGEAMNDVFMGKRVAAIFTASDRHVYGLVIVGDEPDIGIAAGRLAFADRQGTTCSSPVAAR